MSVLCTNMSVSPSDMSALTRSPPTDSRGLVRRNSWARTSLRRSQPSSDRDTLVPPKRWGSFR